MVQYSQMTLTVLSSKYHSALLIFVYIVNILIVNNQIIPVILKLLGNTKNKTKNIFTVILIFLLDNIGTKNLPQKINKPTIKQNYRATLFVTTHKICLHEMLTI